MQDYIQPLREERTAHGTKKTKPGSPTNPAQQRSGDTLFISGSVGAKGRLPRGQRAGTTAPSGRGSCARTNGSNARSNGLGARLSREARVAAAVAWQQPQPRDGARRAAAAGAAEAAGAAGGSGGVLPRPASAAAGGRSAQRPLPPLPRGSLRGAGSAGRGSGAQVPMA